MQLSIDILSGVVTVIGAPILKPGDNIPVLCTFIQNGIVQDLGDGATGVIGVKLASLVTGGGGTPAPFLATASSWTKVGSGLNSSYQFSLNLNTTNVAAAFSALTGSNTTLAALMEIEWVAGGFSNFSASIPFTIYPNVITGTESTPVALPDGKATTEQAEAGTDDTSWMTPLKTAQAIGSLALPDALEFANLAAFPSTGSATVIYLAVDTGFLYRWTGSTYVQVGGTPSIPDAPNNGLIYARQSEAWVSLVPVGSGTLSINGVASNGNTLSDDGGDSWTNSATSYLYQWQSNSGSGWIDIEGATNSSYMLVAGNVGQTIRFKKIGVNIIGNSSPIYSSPTAAITAFVNTHIPTISQEGALASGQLLDDAGGDTWSAPTTGTQIQWLNNGNPIDGATSSPYTIQDSDIGCTISLQKSAWPYDETTISSVSAGLAIPSPYTIAALLVAGGGGGCEPDGGGGGGIIESLWSTYQGLTAVPGDVLAINVGVGGDVNADGGDTTVTDSSESISLDAPGGKSGGNGGASGGGSGNGGVGFTLASDGYVSSITGAPTYYGGGGGRGTYDGGGSSDFTGGQGGGGEGTTGGGDALNWDASAGTPNTGGGGGGAGESDPDHSPKGGGSGVCILSIPTARFSNTYTGSPTIATSGGNTILTFNASGTYTF